MLHRTNRSTPRAQPWATTHAAILLTFVGAALVLAHCTTETVVSPDLAQTNAPAAATGAVTASKADRSTVPVYASADLEEVGSSTLVRNDNGVAFQVHTSGLEPNDIVTFWMFIFNKPENCSPPGCGEDDLFSPGVMADAVYEAGRGVGPSGKSTFAGHRREGDNSGSVFPAWLGLPSPGLMDAREAEIHFVVHSHGEKIPGLVGEMLHSFNAGCGPIFIEGLPAVPESLGTYGPNTCMDVQFALHRLY